MHEWPNIWWEPSWEDYEAQQEEYPLSYPTTDAEREIDDALADEELPFI